MNDDDSDGGHEDDDFDADDNNRYGLKTDVSNFSPSSE